jgi:hypothetical protein
MVIISLESPLTMGLDKFFILVTFIPQRRDQKSTTLLELIPIFLALLPRI